jgi:hypothetical protein
MPRCRTTAPRRRWLGRMETCTTGCWGTRATGRADGCCTSPAISRRPGRPGLLAGTTRRPSFPPRWCLVRGDLAVSDLHQVQQLCRPGRRGRREQDRGARPQRHHGGTACVVQRPARDERNLDHREADARPGIHRPISQRRARVVYQHGCGRPSTKSVMVNSEDGKLYRWSLNTNTLAETITLSPGVGEAYTPRIIGPDGTSTQSTRRS